MNQAAEEADLDHYNRTLETALALAVERYPDAAPEQHAAFANTVAYLVHGLSGGYGGPSTREHVGCSRHSGRIGYEQATREMLDPQGPIFGPITDEHRQARDSQNCFDEASADRQALGLA